MQDTVAIQVLLVDDEGSFRRATARRLRLRGFEVEEAGDGEQADKIMNEHAFDMVICDLKMPRVGGMALLEKRIRDFPATAWIVLTGQGSVETAVSSMKLGAVEYLQKPVDVEELENHIHRAYENNGPARLLSTLRRELDEQEAKFGIVGRSPHVKETYAFIFKAGRSDQPCLITGESGTGKELVARGIHEESDRTSRPFVAVNCASLSDQLLANELFGHVEGAYNGAIGTKLGLFEVADGGTLFIDQIGDMGPQNQAAVLRVIETGQFRRLGDTRQRVVDVRIVAATLCDLPKMVEQKVFRDDLYYRLSVLPFRLEPLHQRREDIPLLVQHFLDRHAHRTGAPKRLLPEALVALQAHDWPGNIRELANVVERAATLSDTYDIAASDLKVGFDTGVPTAEGISYLLDDVEREHIIRVLNAHDGNKQAAAKTLGISRMKLYRKLERHGIE